MRKSIFEIENRLDIQKEFGKIINSLYNIEDSTYCYGIGNMSFYKAIDRFIFKKWKYRDTMLSVSEYLKHIGVNDEVFYMREKILEEVFLYFIEFILNMKYLETRTTIITSLNEDVIIIFDNINLILEKMNYKTEKLEDKIVLVKRNADVDSILDKVSVSVAEALLEYNDFRNQNDLEAKKKILKVLDLYIEEKKTDIKGLDSKLHDSIGTVVNKMGVNHPISEEPYVKYTKQQLIEWYDKCFLMMIHAIRSIDVNKIKQERQELISTGKNE